MNQERCSLVVSKKEHVKKGTRKNSAIYFLSFFFELFRFSLIFSGCQKKSRTRRHSTKILLMIVGILSLFLVIALHLQAVRGITIKERLPTHRPFDIRNFEKFCINGFLKEASMIYYHRLRMRYVYFQFA